MADRHNIEVTEVVEHQLNVFGRPARVLLELDLEREGATIQVPIGDLAEIKGGLGPYAEIRVVFKGRILERVNDVLDDTEMKTGWR